MEKAVGRKGGKARAVDSGVPGAHRERVDSPPLHLTLLSLSFQRYLSPPAISLLPVDSGVPGSPRERGERQQGRKRPGGAEWGMEVGRRGLWTLGY